MSLIGTFAYTVIAEIRNGQLFYSRKPHSDAERKLENNLSSRVINVAAISIKLVSVTEVLSTNSTRLYSAADTGEIR